MTPTDVEYPLFIENEFCNERQPFTTNPYNQVARCISPYGFGDTSYSYLNPNQDNIMFLLDIVVRSKILESVLSKHRSE